MTVLRPGEAREAGLAPDRVARIAPACAAFLGPPAPAYPGFVVLAARHGVVVVHEAGGDAVRYGAQGPVEPVPMRTDTLFDVASLSKLFTALVVVRLAERGLLDLDAPVRAYLPGFPTVPVRSLLTHTSGLPAEIDLGPYPDHAACLAAIAAQPPAYPPGAGYRYSDLGPITAAAVAERVTGRRLDALVAELITGPLGLADTGYRPLDRPLEPAVLARTAATERQPWTGRGMVHGTVHDENAYHLGGIAGHAGIFSTAHDLAVLAQTLLNGGSYGEVRLLGEKWAREMLREQNAHLGPAAARGLGWQLNQPGYMDELASPTAFGHTGFTGTSLVADPATGVLLVLLTNRVHPTREQGKDGAWRRAPARELARAVREAD